MRCDMEAAKLEQWHVRYWTTDHGKREGYTVMLESQRNVSGRPLANYKTREEAQAVCDEHNRLTAPGLFSTYHYFRSHYD